jgi:D-tyrosyl-tRNA(Tyr) deacylase
MRVLLQRVKKASVTINNKIVGKIDQGILLFLGIHQEDNESQAEFLAKKSSELRIFSDDAGKMNLSCKDIGGDALVISQFTLYADCEKGRRPNFLAAAEPNKGEKLYDFFIECLKKNVKKVESGTFAAKMEIDLINDGPVTIILEK